MKIAMLGTRGLPATHGGVERAVEELSTRLSTRGYDVTVFCRSAYCENRVPVYHGVKLRYLPAIPTKHLEAVSQSFLSALIAGAGQFDIVHFHSIGPALFSWIPKVGGLGVVVTIHALAWQSPKWGAMSRLALRAGAAMAARCADANIAVSRQSCEYLRRVHGRDAHFIPNGVAIPVSSARLSECPRDPYLLFLGRLVPEKRVEDLIRAFRGADLNLRLVIAGESCFSDRYVEWLHDIAAGDDRITFVGGIYGNQKETLIAMATALINPSALEGHPIVVLEALAHGVPVLVSDIEAHRQILDDERAAGSLGVSFRTADPVDLAKQFEPLLRLPLDDVARDARRGFVQHAFAWDEITSATEKIYESVMVERSAEHAPMSMR